MPRSIVTLLLVSLAARPAGGWSGVDGTVGVAQRTRLAPRAQGDDLGADRHGGLLRCAGAQIETDRRHDAIERGVVDALLPEPPDAVGMRAARPHGPDVAHLRPDRSGARGDVELVVEGQD